MEGLYILDLDNKHITGLRCFDFEWTGQVMNPCKIGVLHIIGAVVILDLAASPVNALNFDNLSILDRTTEWDCWTMVNLCREYIMKGSSTIWMPPILEVD